MFGAPFFAAMAQYTIPQFVRATRANRVGARQSFAGHLERPGSFGETTGTTRFCQYGRSER
jgi:hypothetical protein